MLKWPRRHGFYQSCLRKLGRWCWGGRAWGLGPGSEHPGMPWEASEVRQLFKCQGVR